MHAPILETARLHLRPYRAADLAPLLAMWQQPALYQHITGKPSTENEVWTRILRDTGLWTICGFGYWAIEEKASGQCIGAVGFADFYRAMQPPLGHDPEAGWILAPHTHGQGYATEALTAALHWADTILRAPRTCCIIDPTNARSLHLAAKLGYRQIGQAEFNGQHTIVLERPVHTSHNPAA